MICNLFFSRSTWKSTLTGCTCWSCTSSRLCYSLSSTLASGLRSIEPEFVATKWVIIDVTKWAFVWRHQRPTHAEEWQQSDRCEIRSVQKASTIAATLSRIESKGNLGFPYFLPSFTACSRAVMPNSPCRYICGDKCANTALLSLHFCF